MVLSTRAVSIKYDFLEIQYGEKHLTDGSEDDIWFQLEIDNFNNIIVGCRNPGILLKYGPDGCNFEWFVSSVNNKISFSN